MPAGAVEYATTLLQWGHNVLGQGPKGNQSGHMTCNTPLWALLGEMCDQFWSGLFLSYQQLLVI